MRVRLTVHVRRGDILESIHHCEAAVSDADGRLHAGTGDPRRFTTLRSAAKPFQLVPLVERGLPERWQFTDEELAVMTASHNGSAYHRGLVSGILERVGAEPRHLCCGYHDPLDPESLAEVRLDPSLRSPLYNNCSGKHAGMLAHAKAEGWPLEGYERPDHPVQQRIHHLMTDLCGTGSGELATATDDCGVPVFAVPLTTMARAYARLASASADGDSRERAFHRIRNAMTSYPGAVGGPQRFSTRLMEATRGRLVAKGGAEGLECVGVPGQGLGLAVKVEDGAHRASGVATVALLEQMGILSEAELAKLKDLSAPVLRNHTGREVGRLEAALEVASSTT